jgi:hypothetical protein
MDWELSANKGDHYPIVVNLTLENPEELADFVARMSFVAGHDPMLRPAMLASQPFKDLPDPNDETFDEFYQELEAFTAEFLGLEYE